MVVDNKTGRRFICRILILPSLVFQLHHVASFVLPSATCLCSIKIDANKNVGRQEWNHHSAIRLKATDTKAAVDVGDGNSIASILSQADPSVDAPLPPSYTKCPFTGIFQGPQSFYQTASKALQSPRLFSFVNKNNQPMVEVSGGANVRKLLNQEFSALSSNAVAGISQFVCGEHSIRTARDRGEHRALRDLVGVPLSVKAVTSSVPTLEAICRRRIQDMVVDKADTTNNDIATSNEIVVKAIDVTQAVALDIAWQQVLGLDLQSKEEIDTFHSEASTWLRGIYTGPGSPEMERSLKVREYLVQMIENKIEQLKEAGQSDGSTVGGLVFATMEDVDGNSEDGTGIVANQNNQRTLSKDEVIDNALLLILASTETTSSVMANALLLMGLHPDVWQYVVDEQMEVVKSQGEHFTHEIVEHDVPYLDAVLKETLRILPVTLVSRRQTTKTVVIDGQQIPRGWGVSYNILLTHQQRKGDGDHNNESLNGVSSSSGMDLVADFQPSRWLNPNTRPKMVDYLPFGFGPRKCPGVLLAMTEMKIFLSILARSVPKYELVMSIDENTPIDEQISWKQLNAVPIPEDGVKIRILS